jgi:hypothetical protein
LATGLELFWLRGGAKLSSEQGARLRDTAAEQMLYYRSIILSAGICELFFFLLKNVQTII